MKNSTKPVIGILGTNGTLSRALSKTEDSLQLAGFNTGNLIYQYAADRHIKGPRLHFSLGHSTDLDAVKSAIDILHIPAANQLNPEVDLLAWAEVVEYLDKPVFIAGLGIQCELSEDDIALTKGTVRFIDALKKRAPAIGVRGVSTQRLLARYGIGNSVVTGCPSNFINRAINGSTLSDKLLGVAKINRPRIDFFPGTMSNHRDVESKLRSIVNSFDCRYVLQTNPLLFNFVDRIKNDTETSHYLEWERNIIAPQDSQEAYNRRYLENSTYYFSAPAWLDSIAKRDLGLGMRMHGVVATIQGGAAGVCVISDGRIQELVDTMGYPNVSLNDVRESENLQEILENVKFNPQAFDEKRKIAFRAYCEIANASGVDVFEAGISS